MSAITRARNPHLWGESAILHEIAVPPPKAGMNDWMDKYLLSLRYEEDEERRLGISIMIEAPINIVLYFSYN